MSKENQINEQELSEVAGGVIILTNAKSSEAKNAVCPYGKIADADKSEKNSRTEKSNTVGVTVGIKV